jgi:hypothetical protein
MAQQAAVPSVDQIASRYGLTLTVPQPEPGLFEHAEAATTSGLTISTFISDQAEQQWIKAANDFGGFTLVHQGHLYLVWK